MSADGREVWTGRVPGRVPSFNVYDRWPKPKQRAAKRQWQWDVGAVLGEKGNQCPRGFDRVELRAIICCSINRDRDSDNYSALLWKWTQDVLTRRGIIPNDTADCCKGHPPTFKPATKDETILIIVGERSAT